AHSRSLLVVAHAGPRGPSGGGLRCAPAGPDGPAGVPTQEVLMFSAMYSGL
ncbi:MAG: hypothetical protein AVDCRST_MAG10-2619, partial [uncultured Acidimicrobiales bacterium]